MWWWLTLACAVPSGGDDPLLPPEADPPLRPAEDPLPTKDSGLGGEALGWDPFPTAPQIGEERMLTASCALLDGELQTRIVYVGTGRWEGTGLLSGSARADLAPCFTAPLLWLEWSHEPSVYLHANGWAHPMKPASSEGRWIGTASPLEPDLACLDVLEAAGIDWPVTMSVHLGPPL